MKIIIAGDGKVGATLTRQFCSEGHDVTVIDYRTEILEASEERYDVIVIQGNCASMSVLTQAGVKEADLLVAVTNHDEINLLPIYIPSPASAILSTTSRPSSSGMYSAFPWSSTRKTKLPWKSTGC